MKEHVLKLMPGQDLVTALDGYCKKHEIEAAYIGTMVGSLAKVAFRKGFERTLFVMDGPFEIVSCVGTLSRQGMHIHASVSDREFKVYGGHIVMGCHVQSTAEIVIIELENHQLSRTKGELTDFKELRIVEASQCKES
ncbi:DNA-binding protein [Erysipelothrix sp. HDW6C]|uniref:PPC domain-containing DNA-binding protein n=1 Tax=Erysipelothrix sp. HDW6C TaxID=2714930 RepID=UPI00140CB504|nr:PPC domain-containing DNA-binding protein [Erysipelothrix sp. HDW6C]QIK69859.1 DNA-binding protein [Erysipelothrix sp. HDW6C]